MSPVSEASNAFSAANEVSIDVFRDRSELYSLSRERSEQCYLFRECSEHEHHSLL